LALAHQGGDLVAYGPSGTKAWVRDGPAWTEFASGPASTASSRLRLNTITKARGAPFGSEPQMEPIFSTVRMGIDERLNGTIPMLDTA
jgi:hypothetical protein